MIMYTLDNLPELLKGWRDYMRRADESLTTILNVMPSFGGNPPGVMLMCCYAGDWKEDADRIFEPLLKLGKVLTQTIQEKDYADVLEDAHAPEGVKVVVNNVFMPAFTDEVIETIVKANSQKPLILQIRSLGGAMRRVASDATAFAHRASEVMIVCPTFVAPNATPEQIAEALKPWHSIAAFGAGAYSNFLSEPTDAKTIYTQETYERLARVKGQYDPDNIFNQNFNIKPA